MNIRLPEQSKVPGRAPQLALLLVIGVALLLRIAPCFYHHFDPQYVFSPDSALYVDLAENLLAGRGFMRTPSSPYDLLENPWPKEVFRTPGYPLFLAGFFLLFGKLFSALILFQIFIDVATLFLVYRLTERLFSQREALIAGALFALSPTHIVQANMIMSDILFAFLVMATIFGALYYIQKSSLRHAIAIGGLCALASVVRPVAFLLAPLLALYILYRSRRVLPPTLFLCIALTFPTAWSVRNEKITGTFSAGSALDFNLYLLTAAKIKSHVDGTTRNEAFDSLFYQAREQIERQGPAAWGEALREAGAGYLTGYPAILMQESMLSLGEMVLAGERRHLFRIFGDLHAGSAEPSISESKRGFVAFISNAFSRDPVEFSVIALQVMCGAAVWLFALVGGIHMWKHKQRSESLLFICIIGYFLAVSLMVASARMRVPFTGVLVILAAHGMYVSLWSLWQRCRANSLQERLDTSTNIPNVTLLGDAS